MLIWVNENQAFSFTSAIFNMVVTCSTLPSSEETIFLAQALQAVAKKSQQTVNHQYVCLVIHFDPVLVL